MPLNRLWLLGPQNMAWAKTAPLLFQLNCLPAVTYLVRNTTLRRGHDTRVWICKSVVEKATLGSWEEMLQWARGKALPGDRDGRERIPLAVTARPTQSPSPYCCVALCQNKTMFSTLL